jgi:hypothetical protein
MPDPFRRFVSIVASVLCIATAASCSSATPAPAPAQPSKPELWGDMKPVVSVKELMRDMIDPIADNVFDAVSTVTTRGQVIERAPKTDEDWDKIRIGGVTLAEGAYLLKVPRPFAPPGDENNSKGPDAGELSPAEIKAKVEADTVAWNAKIEALRNVGLQVMDIVKRRDVRELWDAADNLDDACESCHIMYWYPNQTALMDKLDRRLNELYGSDMNARKSAPTPTPKK